VDDLGFKRCCSDISACPGTQICAAHALMPYARVKNTSFDTCQSLDRPQNPSAQQSSQHAAHICQSPFDVLSVGDTAVYKDTCMHNATRGPEASLGSIRHQEQSFKTRGCPAPIKVERTGSRLWLYCLCQAELSLDGVGKYVCM
jgi:hypothetical protein